jgi:neuropeptide S receptor 1
MQCWLDFPRQSHWQLYVSLIAVSVFVVPALIISVCYTVIVFTIWTNSKMIVPSAKKARLMKSRSFLIPEPQ